MTDKKKKKTVRVKAWLRVVKPKYRTLSNENGSWMYPRIFFKKSDSAYFYTTDKMQRVVISWEE